MHAQGRDLVSGRRQLLLPAKLRRSLQEPHHRLWRAHFHDEHLPFYYVEMQNYGKPQQDPGDRNCAVGDSRATAGLPWNCRTPTWRPVFDQDIGDPNYEPHFPDKKQLGTRLAGLALARLFGQPGLVHSPAFKSVKIEGNKIRVQFTDADGLRLRGSELKGFAILAVSGDGGLGERGDPGPGYPALERSGRQPGSGPRRIWADNPVLSVENSAASSGRSARIRPV